MEASQPDTLGLPIRTLEWANHLVSRGIHQPIDILIAGRTFSVAYVTRRFHDIFVVLKHTFISEFYIILLPQRCHETFMGLLGTIKQFHIDNMYLEYVGIDGGKPVLWAEGRGFCSFL